MHLERMGWQDSPDGGVGCGVTSWHAVTFIARTDYLSPSRQGSQDARDPFPAQITKPALWAFLQCLLALPFPLSFVCPASTKGRMSVWAMGSSHNEDSPALE